MEEQALILFYDGDCGVCNTFVRWVLDRDPQHLFRFAPLQGETAKQALPFRVDLSTVVLKEGDKLLVRSSAVFRAMKYLRLPWPFISLLSWIPRPIRDWGYDVFARRRHDFLKNKACRLLTPEERPLFLP